MTDPRIGPARYPWAAAIYWALVGALGAFGLAALLTIGLFFLAGAAVLTAIAIALKTDRRAAPAVMVGASATPFYIAWLNRGGPGNICTAIENGVTCGEQSNPWPLVAAGVILIVLGVVLLRVTWSRSRRAPLPDPPYPPIRRS